MIVTLNMKYDQFDTDYIDELMEENGEYLDDAIRSAFITEIENAMFNSVEKVNDFVILERYDQKPRGLHPGRKVVPKEWITYFFVVDIEDVIGSSVLNILDEFPGTIEIGNTLETARKAVA